MYFRLHGPTQTARSIDPDFRYYKIAENEFSKRELVTVRNAVSALFMVENSTPEELQRNVSTVLGLLQEEGAREFELFANWVAAYLQGEGRDQTLTRIHSLQEATSMWATAVKKYGDKFLRKGIRQGIERGIEQGIEQGIERGIERGKMESTAETARRAHAAGLDRKTIAAITGLPLKEIDAIIAESGGAVGERRARYRTSSRKKRKS